MMMMEEPDPLSQAPSTRIQVAGNEFIDCLYRPVDGQAQIHIFKR